MKKTNINDKYSGRDKRDRIHLKEPEKQTLRKKEHNVSRTLDNYFWPKLHDRAWWPNGVFITKKGYYYADSGLGYFYEKNNVEQLKDLNDETLNQKKKVIQQYVEYSFLDENRFTVTIEYCANCEEHSTHTRHSPDLYKGFALNLQKCIQLRFPFINVLLKPIDTDILQEDGYKPPTKEKNKDSYSKTVFVNDKFKEVRIGAMEVQICVKFKDEPNPEVKLIHSKLNTGSWPKIPQVLDKIVSFLPLFKGNITLFDKEETEFEEEKQESSGNNANNNNNQENNSQDLIANTKLKNLEVNLYLLRNLKIEQLSEEAQNDINNDEDPHKRKEMILENRRKEKESMYRPTTASYRITSAGAGNRAQSANSLKNSSAGFNRGGVGSGDNNNNYCSTNRQSQTVTISDKTQVKLLKGKHLMRKYTNEDGVVEISPMPYDSYFVEVVESTHFMGLGMPLVFYSINPPSKQNKDKQERQAMQEKQNANPNAKPNPNANQANANQANVNANANLEVIQKYIGLYKQENAFLQLHVYCIQKDGDNEDQVHLPKCAVTLKTVKDEDYQEYLEEKEQKIKIEEKKDGIFEHMVLPGRYLLEVTKDNYEIVRKYCDLDKGLNSINIEMTIERNCNLVISVFNFEKIQDGIQETIQNAEVAIYKNSNDIICEGITDKKGEMKYFVTKNEDFLTIIIKKLGYFPIQRMFLRNKSAPINDKGEYEEHLAFTLVKESFLNKTNSTVIVTYSNLNGPNFKPNFSNSDAILNNLKIKFIDSQNDNGILCCCVNYVQPDPEEDKADDNNNNPDDEEDYEEIVRLSYEITNDALKIPNYQDKGCTMNGLERFGCQTIIYTMNNAFFIAAPSYSKDNYAIWDLGWYDAKNLFFYELSTLWSEPQTRTIYFSHWLDFLQTILDKKIYMKLFEFFGYDKGILLNNDRFVFEANFVKKLEELKFANEEETDVKEFVSDLVKNTNRLISFSMLKKKITSNLKNFKEDLGVSKSKISEMDR